MPGASGYELYAIGCIVLRELAWHDPIVMLPFVRTSATAVLVALTALGTLPQGTAFAQVAAPPAGTQGPGAPSPQPGQPAVPGAGTTPSSASTAGPLLPGNVVTGTGYGLAFGTLGRGLPGLGGPLSTPMGAQAPQSFMSPFVLTPLLCDPAVEIPCY